MRLELQILLALCLDALLGDPRWLPHPVRLIGALASWLEAPTRRILPARAAGLATAVLVVIVAAGTVYGLLQLALWVHPWLGDAVAVLVLFTCFAAGDLAIHAKQVHTPLQAGDLETARHYAGWMVSRDTSLLDAPGVTRATVESVAENTVDGVTAPLFYACLLGPVGAVAYKAVNTLDSTFGYKTERYLLFGWASARIDDWANWLPARLTAALIPLAAAIVGQNAGASWSILRRDGSKHPSPNAGRTEAAMAGALGVQLGGVNVYAGHSARKPTLGDPKVALTPDHIRTATRLMWLTTALAVATFLALAYGLHLTSGWLGGTYVDANQ